MCGENTPRHLEVDEQRVWANDTLDIPALPDPVRELDWVRQYSVRHLKNDSHSDAVTSQLTGRKCRATAC